MKKEDIILKLKMIGGKLADGFMGFARFLSRHKIITVICVVIIVLISTVFGVINHYLNMINYFDPEGTVPVFTKPVEQVQRKSLTLPTGETIDVTNLTQNSDGTYTLSDGRRIDSDGTIWNLDGSIIFYDGSYLTGDGIAVLSDGTTIYTDTNVVFQDGFSIVNTGIKVDKEGYAAFTSGEKTHITAFTINRDGTVKSKSSNLVSPKYSADGTWSIAPVVQTPTTQPEEEVDGDEALEEVRKDKELGQKLKESDEVIAKNNSKTWYSSDVINILLLGIDYGSKNYPYGRSDAIIVLSINKVKKQINLISLSRAAYAAIPGYQNTRVSHAHGYGGPSLSIATIEKNYKIKIDNFISTTFDSFEKIIDAFGGVDIKLSSAEAKAMRKVFGGFKGAGVYHLDGKQALVYARTRQIDSDRNRTGRQRKVLIALAEKGRNMSLASGLSLLNTVLPLVTTDFTKTQLIRQATNAMTYIKWEINQYIIPHISTGLVMRDEFEVLLLDWPKEVEYLHSVMYNGVTPSYID